ncbi:MAG: hypothetical protein V4764_11715 [Burkholderia sp.]
MSPLLICLVSRLGRLTPGAGGRVASFAGDAAAGNAAAEGAAGGTGAVADGGGGGAAAGGALRATSRVDGPSVLSTAGALVRTGILRGVSGGRGTCSGAGGTGDGGAAAAGRLTSCTAIERPPLGADAADSSSIRV